MGPMRRSAITAAAVLLTLVLATACAPDPGPSPSPTGFASDEEAFAAAEATYRAYVDAMNARRADPNSSIDPSSFLSGQALKDSLSGAQRLRDAGVHLEGESSVLNVRGVQADESSVVISVCIDNSLARVKNANGQDVTPASRSDRGALAVELVTTGSDELIVRSDVTEDAKCS